MSKCPRSDSTVCRPIPVPEMAPTHQYMGATPARRPPALHGLAGGAGLQADLKFSLSDASVEATFGKFGI
jgi:hypothetical protein